MALPDLADRRYSVVRTTELAETRWVVQLPASKQRFTSRDLTQTAAANSSASGYDGPSSPHPGRSSSPPLDSTTAVARVPTSVARVNDE